MSILNIMKPALKEVRDTMAVELRAMRKQDRAKARFVLRRYQAGVAATERALVYNLYCGAPIHHSLSQLA
jgi:hypothetical protein